MNLERVIAVRNNKTVYRDGDKAIKVFDANFSKSDILNEALNQARVEEAGIRVPKVLEVSVIDGKWAIVSEYIPGKTLAQLMEENPQNKDAYLEQFVDLQMEVHTHRAPLLNKLHDKMKRKIDETGLDATTRYELHTRLDSTPHHNKVCHGVSTPPTSSCREKQPLHSGLSHASPATPPQDVARTYLLFWLNGDIDGAKKYLNLFCKKSDTARQYVERWLPIVAASQSVKGKPQEREFLLSWVDVAEYQ